LLQQGKIDVFPHKGKRGGAFCSDTSKALPVYIMLNFTGKIRDVSILIHELGHGINALLQRKQNSLNYGAVVSTAEVASTFFESVLMRKLSSNLTGEELLAFRMSVLDDMVSTVQRQIACFRFEQSLHEAFRTEGYLSAQKI
jgi:oligoendopeptidase F